MMSSRHDLAHAAVACGLAASGASVLLGPALVQGGVAVLVVASLAALSIGAPLVAAGSHLRWPVPWSDAPAWLMRVATAAAAAHAAAAVPLVLAIDIPPGASTAAAHSVLGALGVLATGTATLAWLRVHSRSVIWLPTLLVGLGALFALSADGLVTSRPSTPWTLLEPSWRGIPSWGPAAVVLGSVAGGIGASAWRAGPSTRITRRRPWAAVGLALSWLLVAAWVGGVGYERLVHLAHKVDATRVFDILGISTGLATAGVIATLLSAPVAERRRAWAELLGWTVLFCTTGPLAVTWLWSTIVPMSLAAFLATDATRTTGLARLHTAAGAVVLAGVAIAGFPGTGSSVPAAIGAASAVVVITWAAGLRTVRVHA